MMNIFLLCVHIIPRKGITGSDDKNFFFFFFRIRIFLRVLIRIYQFHSKQQVPIKPPIAVCGFAHCMWLCLSRQKNATFWTLDLLF